MIALLISALALYALRGFAEYIVSADLFGGWKLPSWYERGRHTKLPGWIPFRDPWHCWQFIRNRAANLAPVLTVCAFAGVTFWQGVMIYAGSEILWLVGHGATFSVLAKWYAKT